MLFNNTRQVLGVMYTLILLFLLAIYFQGQFFSSVEAATTLNQMSFITAGNSALPPVSNSALPKDTFLLLLVSVTAIFGIAYYFFRSSFDRYF
ncbi:MAG: hypothetical protein D6748_13280 [Calditrichaeota bacterium]|nr:MAG: hypothetical protein D6748_13280 [Calditrichota bacterium]